MSRHSIASLCLFAVGLVFASVPPAVAQPAATGPERPSIIGGEPAGEGRWRFVVALLAAKVPENLPAQFCGGTLIAPEVVLTAAHCVEGVAPEEVAVLVGTGDLGAAGRRIALKRIILHPAYDAGSSRADLALLRLAEPVDGIRPVRRAGPLVEARLARSGTAAIVVGWGDTAEGAPTRWPRRLHQARVRLIDRAVCNAPEVYSGQVDRTMLCAGVMAGGRDSCQGDSGGPLLVRDRRGRFRLQVGIVSWGYDCALPGYPGVYTRLAAFEGWIARHLAAGR